MIGKYAGALIAASVVAAPAAGADDFGQAAAFDSRPAAFAGMTVRVPLGREAPAKPEARLQLTTYKIDVSQPWRARSFSPTGLELGIGKSGKPMLFAGGRNMADVKRKVGINQTTTLLIVGGVLVAVVVVALAAGGGGMGDTCPEVDGSRDHCINP